MRAEQFMAPDPVACAPEQTCGEVARLMRDRAVGCVVVLEHGRVAGLVTDRMLATHCVAEGNDPQAPVADAMVRDVACVGPDATLFAVVEALRGARLARRVPVVGPGRELLGLVGIADVAVVARDLIEKVLEEETQRGVGRPVAVRRSRSARPQRPGARPSTFYPVGGGGRDGL